jgi:hypothetical protein
MGNGIRRKDQKHTVRDRADIMWQDANINVYGFEDINQIALDDRYGKVGAPLSKRRNGVGPAGRDAPPGLFGTSFSMNSISIPHFIGGAIVGYFVADYIVKRK